MSNSKLFYTLINDKNTIFQKVEFRGDHIIFRARLKKNSKLCPSCQSSAVRIKETKERTFRMVNLGQKRTYLKMDTYKIWCQKYDKKAWIELPFAFGKLPMTASCVHFIIQLTAMTTLLCVAFFLG